MKIGLSSAAYYGQLETDEAAAHIAKCFWKRPANTRRILPFGCATT